MIPLATTTIAVRRVTADLSTVDPYEATAAPETVASGVRAHISTPSGRERIAGTGAQEDVSFRLDCDPIDVGLRNTDLIDDEFTGTSYAVVWAEPRAGLGLDHIEAALRKVEGVV